MRILENQRKGCTCAQCKALCRNESGWFMPEEIGPAAKFLKLSKEKFEKEYCEEHFFEGVVCLSPKMLKGACIFLKKGLCSIHPVKPYECRKVFGCEADRRHKRIREIIARKWK